MQKLVVLSGAGVSAESGIKTFRDSNGLWEEYRVEDVASIDGWHRNRELVIEFYNQRRRQLETAQPNDAHKLIAALEKTYNVTVITQNVDNLHERGGSTNIIHLHGELTKVRSVKVRECDYSHPDTVASRNDVAAHNVAASHNDVAGHNVAASHNTVAAHNHAAESASKTVFDIGYKDIHLGDLAPDGGQLRPHIVWFGEAVPELARAAKTVEQADILLIIGTSLNVYPAAGLINYTNPECRIFLIDPRPIRVNVSNFKQIQAKATDGMRKLMEILH